MTREVRQFREQRRRQVVHVRRGEVASPQFPAQVQLEHVDVPLLADDGGELEALEHPAINVGGDRIEPGERVLLMQASANRDPRRFTDLDGFDIARLSNRHVGFGYSIHYCLGANIARLEGALGLEAFRRRFPDTSLATDRFEWDRVVLSRSLKRLPVRLGVSTA